MDLNTWIRLKLGTMKDIVNETSHTLSTIKHSATETSHALGFACCSTMSMCKKVSVQIRTGPWNATAMTKNMQFGRILVTIYLRFQSAMKHSAIDVHVSEYHEQQCP